MQKITKKYYWYIFFTIILILASCGKRGTDDIAYNEAEEVFFQTEPEQTPTPAPIRAPTPLPTQPPSPSPLPTQPPNFVSVSGVIKNFEGPVEKDGTVPWYVEWIEIEAELDDGSTAIIAGTHRTVYIFGAEPVEGMTVTAYFPENAPIYIHEPPLYLASVIAAGLPQDKSVAVYNFANSRERGNIYTSVDGSFSYSFNEETELQSLGHGSFERWRGEDNVSYFSRWIEFYSDAVIYNTEYEEIPIAERVFGLNDQIIRDGGYYVERSSGNYNTPVVLPESMELTFTEHIFPMSDFETVNIQIFANGVEIDYPPPILSQDGTTILVPFRPINEHVGTGNYAEITAGGKLDFGGGGGGSENNYWMVGRPYVYSLAYYFRRQLCSPPIIVGGVIYTPVSSITIGIPYTNMWIFDDHIDFFGEQYQFGRNQFDSFEDNTELPIVVNGVGIDSPPAIISTIFISSCYSVRVLLIPIEWVAEALWGNYSSERLSSYENHHLINDVIYVELHSNNWGYPFNSIIHEGRVLIANR